MLAGSLATGAAIAAPTRVFAQVSAASESDRAILAIAAREVARAEKTLWQRDLAAIADFGAHSALPRFHFANLEAGTVTSYRVAHGSGSDPEHDGWLNSFSNTYGSNATSRGAYATWEWYDGAYGTSIRLGGLESDNDMAEPRAIVMHSASYVTEEHVASWGKAGRSNGCFAMAPEDFKQALWRLAGGRLLFADRLGVTPTA